MPADAAQTPSDQRAGLPPVDHKPAEAPLKDLFPKPSQGGNPASGEMKRREKPQLSDAASDPSEQTPGQTKLGGLAKPKKQPRHWVPVALIAVTVTALTTVGILALNPSEIEESPNASIPNAESDGPKPDTSKPVDNTYSRLAGLLARANPLIRLEH
ncbi:MAG: hypothetical protein GWQ05_16200 [Verrucomicrobiaceae bacterium]|nr:hypothetical protein [Verrucomicrobiaceae bacterium]